MRLVKIGAHNSRIDFISKYGIVLKVCEFSQFAPRAFPNLCHSLTILRVADCQCARFHYHFVVWDFHYDEYLADVFFVLLSICVSACVCFLISANLGSSSILATLLVYPPILSIAFKNLSMCDAKSMFIFCSSSFCFFSFGGVIFVPLI